MNFQCNTIHRCLCALLVIAGTLALPGAARAEDSLDYIHGEIVVKLFSASDLSTVAADYGLDPAPLSQFGSRPIFRLRIVDGQESPDKAVAMAADSRVEYVEPNYLHSTPEGQKRSSWARVEGAGNYADQWAAAQINLPAAHGVARGAGVVVAILDTGVDATHPALAGKVVGGYDFVDMDMDPSEVGVAQQDIVFGHGTHVAGIVALTAPDAKIMPLRVLDRNGAGNMWVLAEALSYSVNPDGNVDTDDGATVVNLSLSTLRRTAFMDEVVGLITCSNDDDDDNGDNEQDEGEDEEDDDNDDNSDEDDDAASVRFAANGEVDDDDCLSGRGAVVVAAAGNNGDTRPEYPAAEGSQGLLAVAATTQADARAAFSNHGAWVSIGAPGETILSAVPGGIWGAWSGTSMAAPLAAGVAALVQSYAPQLTPAQVAQHITATAAHIGGDVPLRIDAGAALGATPAVLTDSGIFLAMVRGNATK